MQAGRPRRDPARDPLPAGWEQQQRQRQLDAERKRLAQVQRDLAYIQQLRSRGDAQRAVHTQVMQHAQEAIDAERSQAHSAASTLSWLAFTAK